MTREHSYAPERGVQRSTFRQSVNYQEAQRRLTRKARCGTDLGRYWNHHEFIAALKALLAEKRTRGAGGTA